MRVNVPLQDSNRIFACGEIIKMHTIHEGNYTVIKLPRSGNNRAKKINKEEFRLWKLSNVTNGMEVLDFYTDHPFVDSYKTTQEDGHSQHFSNRIGFCN